MQSVTAWQRLMTARAVSLGQPTSADGASGHALAVEKEMQAAFPPEA